MSRKDSPKTNHHYHFFVRHLEVNLLKVSLKWDNISKEEKADLLTYFAGVSRSFGGYSNSEREKLKRMPIYQTAEGKCVRLQSRRAVRSDGDSDNNEFKHITQLVQISAQMIFHFLKVQKQSSGTSKEP